MNPQNQIPNAFPVIIYLRVMNGLLGKLKKAQQVPSAVVTNVSGEDESEGFGNTSEIQDAFENTSGLSDVFESTRTGGKFSLYKTVATTI